MWIGGGTSCFLEEMLTQPGFIGLANVVVGREHRSRCSVSDKPEQTFLSPSEPCCRLHCGVFQMGAGLL